MCRQGAWPHALWLGITESAKTHGDRLLHHG